MGIERISKIFKLALKSAKRRSPWVPNVRVRFCPLADRDHKKKWRQFAHSLHVPGYVCWARAAEGEMHSAEILGMGAHELGHIVAMKLKLPEHMKPVRGKGTPKRVQDEADTVAHLLFGIKIRYNRRTLQEVV